MTDTNATKKETIGVVVLSYNKAHIFPKFWVSLLHQTRYPNQIVIVDDGSTDGTRGLLKDIARIESGVQVLDTPRLRQSAARNHGLRHINTDRVIFLDGDLTLQVNMLGRMEVELDDHPEVSFVYCPYDRTGAQRGRIAAYPWDVARLRTGNYISPMSLIRRAHLPNPCFDESLHRYEDWDLWVRMAKEGRCGRLINEMLFTAHYLESDLSGRGEDREWFFAVKHKHGFLA